MSLPWKKSVTVPAEAIQLEAVEEQHRIARASLREIDELCVEITERLSKLFPLCTTDQEQQRYRNVKQLLNQVSAASKKGLGES
jgi:hypothetical protein